MVPFYLPQKDKSLPCEHKPNVCYTKLKFRSAWLQNLPSFHDATLLFNKICLFLLFNDSPVTLNSKSNLQRLAIHPILPKMLSSSRLRSVFIILASIHYLVSELLWLNVCVPPKFTCWNPNPQCDDIWTWCLCEVIRPWGRSPQEWN